MKKLSVVCLIFSLIFSMSASASEGGLLKTAQEFVSASVTEPRVGSVGGEWAVLGLVRSDAEVAGEYSAKYCENVKAYIKECGGILHDKKYTEYSRVILALSAIGENPEEFAGYNLLRPLADFEKTVFQGINGAIWALIALDSRNYEIPENENANVSATRDMYVNYILSYQLENGSFPAGSGTVSDIDITAMAITALSKYQNRESVKTAIEKAVLYLTDSMEKISNSENISQIIVALSSVGRGPVLNERNLVDMLSEYLAVDGGFRHTSDAENSNLMASEQALCALAAMRRFETGRASVFDMSDVPEREERSEISFGLIGKHPDIKKSEIVNPAKSFSDIIGHKGMQFMQALAVRGIINGKSEDVFDPDATMTRAEFAAIVVKSLGLETSDVKIFEDVEKSDWFYGYVAAANSFGIVNGISETDFAPNAEITKEEAAVMVARAAEKCGMNTNMDETAVLNILAGFTDYIYVSDWAEVSLAFCFDSGIMSDEDIEILPDRKVTRAEIAVMLYNLLDSAELL